jgi:hypothetical protein
MSQVTKISKEKNHAVHIPLLFCISKTVKNPAHLRKVTKFWLAEYRLNSKYKILQNLKLVFLAVLGFELKALGFLGRHSTAPAFFALGDRVLLFAYVGLN